MWLSAPCRFLLSVAFCSMRVSVKHGFLFSVVFYSMQVSVKCGFLLRAGLC